MQLQSPSLARLLVFTRYLLGWSGLGDQNNSQVWLNAGDAQKPLVGAFDRDKVLTPSLKEYIRNATTSLEIPGLSVAVVHAEDETEFGSWGIRSESGDPMTSDTMFTIASCSKAFMSTAMAILIDDYANGRNSTPLPEAVRQFDWETKIKALLPDDWNLMDSWAEEKANIKDILSHVSGIPRHDLSYSRSDTPESVLKRLQYLRPAFELRQQFSYNNLMYMVGAHIFNIYAGGYTKFVENRVFKPLGMSSTFSPKTAAASGKATHTWSRDGRRIPRWFTEEDFELSVGPGGVIASAEDLVRSFYQCEKWVKMHLHGGIDSHTNHTIVPQDLLEETTSAHVIYDGTSTDPQMSIKGYGMGWTRYSLWGHDIVMHTGGIPGITTVVTLAPTFGIGVVVLINADGHNAAAAMTDISNEILSRSFQVTVTPGETQPSHQPGLVTPTPSNSETREAMPAFDFTGTYHDNGYGHFIVCNTTTSSDYCHQVLADFKAVDPHTPAPTELYASYPRLWSTHLRFTHVKDHRFYVKPTALFPVGYGKNTTPFEVPFDGGVGEDGFAIADFVVEDGKVVGFGFSGTVAQKTMMQKKGGSVKETAEAWFERV
ncbi:beta-lactamase/transpeptidase-like protein [Amylostereum chailletii]|nr:beta-lactamase/transpeptidase-like protein [Amylostereum chailletii]